VNFAPKTERAIIAELFWPRGEYDFEVVEAEETVSGNGNAMMVLRLRLFREGHNPILIRDYLMTSKPLKLVRIARACGLLPQYFTGSLVPSDFLSVKGRLKLGIDRQWGNVVKDYVK
jgi:hypothetical protein